MFNIQQTGQSRLPTTIHDYLPWKYYEMLPKNDLGLSIPFLNSPFHFRHYTAWHIKEKESEHSYKYLMMEAIRENNINRVKELLDWKTEEGTRVMEVDEQIEGHLDMNSVQMSCMLGRGAILEYLLLRGADVNHQSLSLHTPLMFAVNSCQFDVIKLLLHKTNLNPHLKDKFGYTAIQQAKIKGLYSIANYLESHFRNQEEYSTKQKQHKLIQVQINLESQNLFQDQLQQQLINNHKYLSNVIRYPFNNIKQPYIAQLYNPTSYLD